MTESETPAASKTPADGVETPTPAPAAEAPAEQPLIETPAAPEPDARSRGTGRRKSSVARVYLSPGDGKISINKRSVEDYFTEQRDRQDVLAPFEITNTLGKWDAMIKVGGGGRTGQAGAIRLGIARALLRASDRYEPLLRESGYLTRDSRMVERKKYGQRGARRRFQFSKR